MIIKTLRFLGLLTAMCLLTYIPFGIYVNTVIMLYGLWLVANKDV